MSLLSQQSLLEYFREAVVSAVKNQQLDLTEQSEYYIVNLLAEFSLAQPEQDLPLALLFERANSALPDQRIRLFKQLGDMALYVAGFFAESFRRRVVDVDYYIDMGGAAYGNLSQVLRDRGGEAFGELYSELATKFVPVVDVLNEIAENASGAAAKDHLDLLRLYERWLKTRSERLRSFLVHRGVIPNSGIVTKYVN